MNGKSASPQAGRGTSAPLVSDCPDDISKLFPLSLCRSQLIPPAPNRRPSAIDFHYDFCGSSWVAYGASSLLVISHFPSPLSSHESLVGPFFRQVIEPPTSGTDDGTNAVNAVSWCPVCPSEGEVAAAQGNSIRLYAPRADNDTGSFCWGQTAGILQTSMVEAIEWTGSGDGIIAAGIEVVFWHRKGRSWVMAWKSLADVPQVMVSATWSSEGLVATSGGCLLTSSIENSPNLANGGCKHVSVYQNSGKSEVLKIQLYHPQPISLIRWRPSTSISLTKRTLHAWRDVLLTCCLDGTVRFWSEIDNGRSKKLIKGIDHKMSKSFQVVAIIEIEQCLNGTLGTDVFIDWAGDMGSVILTSEEVDYSLPSVSSRLDNIASCEWLISAGPVNSVTFWVIHCLDDVVTFCSPRVTLWTKRNPVDFQAGNFSFYPPMHPEEKPILVKVVVSRSQLFGPPVTCSLLQLLPGNSMNWWHFYSPSIDDAEQISLTQDNKKRCLSHFVSGVLNLDGHTANILQLALHPYSFELELAVSLDSNGFLLFWSLPKNFNCTLGIQRHIHPTWKLIRKIRSQDLSVDLKYLTMAWLHLVLDDKPLLLLGYADGIDCFLINASGEGDANLCCKIFSLSFAGHNHSEGSPDHIFATPLPSFSTSFLLFAVWMKEFKTLSWKVVLQSEVLTGNSCAFVSESESVPRPENISGRKSCSCRYSAATSPASWNFPNPHTSKIILCFSVVTLDTLLSNGKHMFSDNDSCGNSCSLVATGCSDGILQLWKVYSAKSSELECIPWFYLGEFAAHDGPVNAVSLSNCGSKVATVSIGPKNSNFTLHIWTPTCFRGGGSFILEDVLLLSGPVVALKWLTIGNGKLLLGVCMPNEFHIYCQRRAYNDFLEEDKLEEKHAWCCISISHSHHPCHEFLWGSMLTPILLHENKISIFSEWLCETEYKHIGDISSKVTDEHLCCDISLENNVHGAKELKNCGEKETGIFLDVLFSESFMKNNMGTRKRLHNLMDIVERLCGPLESYHPWALLQHLYRGNWKRAYIVLKHLVDSLKSSGVSTIILESCNLGKCSYIPQIPLPEYFKGMNPGELVSSTSQWGQGNSFVSETSEKNAFLFGDESLKPLSLAAYPKSEIVDFIETLETDQNLSALTSMERIQILSVLEVLLELGQTTLYESLDEAARRFWVAVRFQHFHFIRKAGKVADAEQHAIESWLVAWAFQSDSQGSLLNAVLSAEPSWLQMRNLGLGFWLTNVSELRARMEKLARMQYLKYKNPKDCALLYIALNRLQVLAGLFKISIDEKDKVLFKFLSRNFQDEKNKAAALKNAYVLMGRHQLELAVTFFLLGGEPFSAVTVCAKNLGDEQLALVICRLLEGFGGPLEHQLITNILLPSAIEIKDYWLSSLLDWTLGNYSESVKRLFEPSGHPTNQTSARKCPHASLADPNIGRYCVVLASKHCLRNSIGDYQATVLSKLATMMDSYSLERFGLPLEALECFASYTMKGNTDGSSEDIESHDIFQVLLNPFSTSSSTRIWLQEGFAYHLESNIRFSLAMQHISRLLREFPCWTCRNSAVFPELLKQDDFESDGDEYLIEEFRHKLNLVILVFEQRFSLKLIDLANMVLLFARNNGLLFIGYKLVLGIVTFWEHEVDNHREAHHSTVDSVVLRLLVQASKQLLCVFSRYIVSCHISDSTLKLLSGSLSTEEKCNDYHFQRFFCLRSLICSLRIIKPLLKYYDHLLVTEGHTLNTYSLFELVEYMIHFSYNWFSRNFRALIQMVYQIRKASLSNHDSIQVLAGGLMKILCRNTCEALNDDAEVLRDFISDKKQVEQNKSLALSIPEDERRLLTEVSLWMHNNSFTNKHLSKFLGTGKFATGWTKTDHDQFPVLLTKLTMASIAYISSSLTRQLASFLRKKASQDLSVATFAWFELTNHCEFSSLPPDVDQGVYIRQLSSIEEREALFERLWVMSVNAKEIFQNLNETFYGFTYESKKLPSFWKDFLKVNLSEDESLASHHRSEGKFISASSVTGAILGKESSDADNSLERRKESNPKLENANFFNPSEIVNRSGELLEAICCNSIDEQHLAVASNRKGLLFLNWKVEPSHKGKPLLIWPEADWPLNGCTSFENTPVSTCVSQDVGLLCRTGSYVHATAEKVSSRSLRSHPSRPFVLVGSINTHIYLWEFGREKSTATFGVLPAASVPPPHALASISSLEFNHSGHRFASTALDGTVCTWQLGIEGRNNVPPMESMICFSTHASDVAYVAASGSILVVAGCSANGQNIVLWDTLAPPATSQASLFCHEGGASSLAVFNNDVGTGSVSPIIVTGGKTGDVVLHDLRYIVTGRSKRHQQPRDRDFKSSKVVDSSQHFDSTNGMIWYIPKAHLGTITRITTIPNTNMFLTGSKDGDVKLWDAKRAQLVFQWRRIHDRHTFIETNSRSIGGVVRAAVTDIEVFSHGFLTCGGDGSVKLVQLK